MSDVVLSESEVVELAGGYVRPSEQLVELHRQGYWRARRSPITGRIVLARVHVTAVQSGAQPQPISDFSKTIPARVFHVHSARRARAMRDATPPWADRTAIEAIYAEARRRTADTGEPHHVDHEIPLLGRLVSGLHVETNLRVMLGVENTAKGNSFEP